MYNSITEEKIKQIPQIGDIDINRLPQELTKIYAQVIGLRHQVTDGTVNFLNEEIKASIQTLYTLANNLETILITFPNHERKESIAFVAGTAHSLIHRIELSSTSDANLEDLQIDTISSFISAIVLFLIGNSQADAAEASIHLQPLNNSSKTKQKLIAYLQALAKGRLLEILDNPLVEDDIRSFDLQEAALDYLWRELGLGIYNIASKLLKRPDDKQESNHFDSVINLSISEEKLFNQKSIFTGPYHLARILKLLEADILKRGITDIPPPKGINVLQWQTFLEKLAQERPYLWENHKKAVDTNFLESGISAVLTLPTGSGKSTLAELKIASCFFAGKRIIYLVPTHALEDQVNKNLKALFEGYTIEYNEFDAEFTEFGDTDSFPILVMTPERCLTLQNINPEFFQNVGLVVFDEFHLIHGTDINNDRRSIDAMYCIVSLFTTIPQADYLLISAMVENGEEIAEWIQSVTGRECILFNSSWKPTRQLHGCLIFEEQRILELNKMIRQAYEVRKTKYAPTTLQNGMTITPHCFVSLRNIWETVEDNDYYKIQILEETVLLGINNSWKLTTNRNEIAAKLGIHFSKMGLKTLIFVDSPKIAQSTSKKINEGISDRANSYSDFNKKNLDTITTLQLELGSIKHSFFHNQDNVGIHHGLLLPLERGLIEQYFKRVDGSIALVATPTLAQGINLPAEIVIIAGDDRYNEGSQYRERVQPYELLNAAGRAGRAGQSSQGVVILIPGEIVTIKDSNISDRWWKLKNEVFSKSDQCLKIEDPLKYFLDSIQNDSEPLDANQINILYRFKSKNLSETETEKLFSNSFYAYKSAKESNKESFSALVNSLLRRRNELDTLSKHVLWTNEISFKTGVDPNLILEIGNALDQENIEEFINLSVIQFIEWFFNWLQKNNGYIEKIYSKQSTINQIKKATGLNSGIENTERIIEQLPSLKNLIIQYIMGISLEGIDQLIPGRNEPYLIKARNFVIRLVPDISFSFGLLSMIVIEKAQQKGIDKATLPWTIRALSSCIREGFDEVEKLFYKRDNILRGRVETHQKYH